MKKNICILSIILIILGCKWKVQDSEARAAITIWDVSCHEPGQGVKVVLREEINGSGNRIAIKEGYTDVNGYHDFGKYRRRRDRTYGITIEDRCYTWDPYIYIKENISQYQKSITTLSYPRITCVNAPPASGSDSVLIDFKHKYNNQSDCNFLWISGGFCFVGTTAHFYYSSKFGTTSVWATGNSPAYAGWHYIHIYKYKAGVYSETSDSVFLPSAKNCDGVVNYDYNYNF